MHHLAPLGQVYQAGTLSGNPLAMAAGIATVKKLLAPGFHQELSEKADLLLEGLQHCADKAGVPFHTVQVGGMFGLFFTDQPKVERFDQVMKTNTDYYGRFFHAMLGEKVYLAPSAFEAGFISIAHGIKEIKATINSAERAFASLLNS